jgi:diketogulonate reductase-like aldo/keto reductase
MNQPSLRLPSGDEMPMIGLGTWDLDGQTVTDSVRLAVEAGYRHIDTAEGYQNEREVAKGLTDIDREDLWITSKVLPKNLNYDSVISSCRASLRRLDTDYLDLYLVHWPNPAISLRETLDAMAFVKEQGYVRNVGVSNFSAYQLSCAQHISRVPIAVNQIEYHPWYPQEEVVNYSHSSGVAVAAAAPLARTTVFDDPIIRQLADAHDVSPATIILRWAIDNDVVVLPKSSDPDHIVANLKALEVDMDAAEHDKIEAIDRHQPVYDTPTRDWTDPIYGISE